MKRARSSESTSNEKVESEPNRESRGIENSTVPSTLSKPVSPPHRRLRISSHGTKSQPDGASRTSNTTGEETREATRTSTPTLAAIEAGQTTITHHLSFISSRLRQTVRPAQPNEPRLALSDWVDLYRRNEHDHGTHFVIHQHDHPVAGAHYDLRLQFSATSSVSWSVVFGMPGDPNSRKPNRNAIETRVHCLWVSAG